MSWHVHKIWNFLAYFMTILMIWENQKYAKLLGRKYEMRCTKVLTQIWSVYWQAFLMTPVSNIKHSSRNKKVRVIFSHGKESCRISNEAPKLLQDISTITYLMKQICRAGCLVTETVSNSAGAKFILMTWKFFMILIMFNT